MRKEIEDLLKEFELSPDELLILRFSPRAIVLGLQASELALNEQLAFLEAIWNKYGQNLDYARRLYLQEQVNALRIIICNK